MARPLNTEQAAEFLGGFSHKTIEDKARSGELPAAKVFGKWLFIDVDLVDYIRAHYNTPRERNAGQGEKQECLLSEKTANTGTTNLRLVEKQYSEALEPRTKPKHRK